jgi:hypothetical protein
MGFPLMGRATRLSIEAVDRRLEGAAATLGAGPVWVFLVITLPLALPGIIAGMVLSFARSMGEFGATITFVANIPGETQTLPSAIYTLTQIPGGDAGALRLTLISIAISMLALLAAAPQPHSAGKLILASQLRMRFRCRRRFRGRFAPHLATITSDALITASASSPTSSARSSTASLVIDEVIMFPPPISMRTCGVV